MGGRPRKEGSLRGKAPYGQKAPLRGAPYAGKADYGGKGGKRQFRVLALIRRGVLAGHT